jgi:hypothetical protein
MFTTENSDVIFASWKFFDRYVRIARTVSTVVHDNDENHLPEDMTSCIWSNMERLPGPVSRIFFFDCFDSKTSEGSNHYGAER